MDATGIRGDPEKTSAIDKVPRPNNVLELRQFMGMLNQLGKFSINYQPMRDMLSTRSDWTWNSSQERPFWMQSRG